MLNAFWPISGFGVAELTTPSHLDLACPFFPLVQRVQTTWQGKRTVVYHYWYWSWPDHGAPKKEDGTLDPQPLIDLLIEVC